MGDFDRTTAPGEKPSETKKMVTVIALGAVLVGVVVWQMMKNGDGVQQAAGAPVASDLALPAPVVSDEISPANLDGMKIDLAKDPTKKLLTQDIHEDHTLDAVPHNPFAMNRDWLASLIRPVGPATAPWHPAIDVGPATSVAIVPPAPAPRTEDFKLAGIVNGNTAIINGKFFKVGDVVTKAGEPSNRARVLQIRNDGVVLQQADAPKGLTLDLLMNPALSTDQ